MTAKKVKIAGLRLSQLLRLAVKDAYRVERSRKYTHSMWTWFFRPNSTEKCAVCFAGGIMAYELPVPKTGHAKRLRRPFDFDPETERALHAVNVMRAGRAKSAYLIIHKDSEDGWDSRKEQADREFRALINQHYDMNVSHAPWHVYLEGAKILHKAGL